MVTRLLAYQWYTNGFDKVNTQQEQFMSKIIRDTIDRILDRVNAISAPGPGYTRPSYSPLETAAHKVIAEEAERLGLEISCDSARNLYARLPGADRAARPFYVGSHLDTVSMGGAYDGAAGVAGAMALAASYVHDHQTPPADLIVTVIRAEESVWFPASYVGSRAALGKLRHDDLDICRSDSGRTLAAHMIEEGGDPSTILASGGLSPANFIELHIEQGPVLHDAGESFALVTGIRGGLRYRSARIDGVWAHSGGAPREGRADTVFALADLVTALDAAWETMLGDGRDLAVTFGRVDAASEEHAFAKIPGRLDFCIDLRSGDDHTLDLFDGILQQQIAVIEAKRGVRFDLGPRTRSTPSRLSDSVCNQLERSAFGLGHKPRRMLSGGGHDAAAFASNGWQSTMIFLRNWNGSHNPAEGMDHADLASAVQVVRAALASTATVT